MYTVNYKVQLILLAGLMLVKDDIPCEVIKTFVRCNYLFADGQRLKSRRVAQELGVHPNVAAKHINALVRAGYLKKSGFHFYELDLNKVAELNLLLK